MYNLDECYQTIDNPINDEVIREFSLAYAKNNNLLDLAINSNSSKNTINDNKVSNNELYINLYKMWKDYILNMSQKEIDANIENNIFDSDFYDLQKVLSKISDIKSKSKFEVLLSKYPIIKKYSFIQHTSSERILSSYFLTKNKNNTSIEHLLYLNPKNEDVEKILLLFIDKCQKYQLPFYLKYNDGPSKIGSIIIYSDKNLINKYISIIKEMELENRKLFKSFSKPPLLTGKIDKYIGYAESSDDRLYLETRVGIIQKAIYKENRNWLIMNLNKSINYQEDRIILKEFLKNKISDEIVTKYTKLINGCTKQKHFNEIYDEYGLQASDVKSVVLRMLADYYTDIYFDEMLNDFCSGKEVKTYKIPMRDKKSIIIYGKWVESIFKSLVNYISNVDSNYTNNVKDNIKKLCIANNIDENNIAFASGKNNVVINTDNAFNKSYDINNIYLAINPEIIKHLVITPERDIIAIRDYIEKYIFPYIPVDGFYTMKDGSRVPFNEFIEDYIVFEIGRYNGNFVKALIDNVRFNRGQITVDLDEGQYSFPADLMSSYINQKLLKKKICLPDQNIILVKEYIDNCFSQYIPENGMFTLKNGKVVSAKDFIENYLLKEGQLLYDGDIESIIKNTIILNRGIINMNYEKEYNNSLNMKY